MIFMKNELEINGPVSENRPTYRQKLLAQIAQTKEAVAAEFRDFIADHQQVLRLALNEAEALAWQTNYPQLVFADLAEEKVQGVIDWIARQREVAIQTLGFS
jgi:hypothetical protein